MSFESSQPPDARAAIERLLATEPFGPTYQPIVDLATGFVAGYEAFTRFASGADRAAVLAEARGVGLDLDVEIAMLRQVLRIGRGLPGGRWLAIRSSRRLLDDERLPGVLAVADRPIQLEVCASEVDRPDELLAARLRSMATGVGLAVLVGPAELARCGQGSLPDLVKIEPPLTRRAGSARADRELLAARRASPAPDAPVVAEGIVSARQVRHLAALGIEYGQGDWFGRPEPVTVRPSDIN